MYKIEPDKPNVTVLNAALAHSVGTGIAEAETLKEGGTSRDFSLVTFF